MIIVDSHQDIAWNMLTFGRDYTRSASETRRLEAESIAPHYNGDTLLGWPDYQRGGIALIFASLFASPIRFKKGEWQRLCFSNQHEASQLYHAQLDAYERLVAEHPDMFEMVESQSDLDEVLFTWKNSPDKMGGMSGEGKDQLLSFPVGLVISMEGAEAVREPTSLEEWWERGVRIIGPAWAGNRFCGGTDEPGPLTSEGLALLEAMAEFGFGLDLSHMDERAALQALDAYPGQVLVSHSNALSLLKETDNNRHLTDRVIRGLVERNAVIGIVPYNVFLNSGWRGGNPRQEVSLLQVVDQIDHVCQIAGDARHIGIGSDFDGGFGVQCVPAEIETISDLQKLAPLLEERGYSQSEQAGILADNWLDCLRNFLPVT